VGGIEVYESSTFVADEQDRVQQYVARLPAGAALGVAEGADPDADDQRAVAEPVLEVGDGIVRGRLGVEVPLIIKPEFADSAEQTPRPSGLHRAM